MRWGSVLLKCEVIRVLLNIGQKISRKQYNLDNTDQRRDQRRRIAEEWVELDQRIIDKTCWRLAKETSSVRGCRWRTLWTQYVTFSIYDILYRNFKTQLFEILLFCSVNNGCFVEYNTCYVLHFVTAIILRHVKNIQLQTTSPESKCPNEYSDVIFIQIHQHLKKLLQKYKGVPILWITV